MDFAISQWLSLAISRIVAGLVWIREGQYLFGFTRLMNLRIFDSLNVSPGSYSMVLLALGMGKPPEHSMAVARVGD